ncbi:YvrJ family protein [Clostridium botulinum]|uniref:YvrJ family protein n=1 Tax=Clostridium botulinum TaxID=1491 RepID=UPI003DA3AE2E
MDEFITLIANVGFPISISAYLLIRIETKLDKLTESISELSTVISINQGNKKI